MYVCNCVLTTWFNNNKLYTLNVAALEFLLPFEKGITAKKPCTFWLIWLWKIN